WTVADKNNTNVAHLKKVNHLDSDLIFPKQVIKVDGKDSSSKSSTSKESSSIEKSNSPSSSSTYTVEDGDTLSQIAADHDTSVDKLKKNNNLDSSVIYPGDKIKVDGSSSSSSSSSKDDSSSDSDNDSSSSSSSSSYTVKSVDTLGKIANKQNVSVSDLKSWNNISGHMIYVGDKLSLKEGSSSSASDSSDSSASNEDSSSSDKDADKDNDKSSSDSDSKQNVSAPASNGTDVVSKANSQVGAPYEWAGA